MKTASNNVVRSLRKAMLVLLAGIGAQKAVLAAEPDDFPASATNLDAYPSATVSALLGDGPAGANDVDFYRLNVDFSGPTAYWLLTVDVVGTHPLDAYLRLFGGGWEGNVELARDDDRAFGDRNPLLRTYLIKPTYGTYYFVAVSTAGNPNYDPDSAAGRRPGIGGTYTLSVGFQRVAHPESPYELNDEFATFMGEGSFEVKTEFVGDGDGRRDVDLYRITLARPARLDIAASVEEIDSPLDPVVQVFRSLGLEDATFGISDHNPGGTRDAVLSLGIPEPGDVFIAVYGNGNPIIRDPAGDHGEVGSVGPYNLSVRVTPYDSAGPFEPNDSLSFATSSTDSRLDFPLASGSPSEVTVAGHLGDGPYQLTHGDRDFYNIAVRKSGYVTIQVNALPGGTSQLDPILAIYDPLGNRIQTGYAHGGEFRPMVLPLTCGAPTTYIQGQPVNFLAATAMIMGNGHRFPNDPYVPMNNPYHERPEEFATGDGPGSVGPYLLEVSWRDANDACGTEPDDTITLGKDTGLVNSGGFLCTNNYLGDSNCPNPTNDVDFWKFNVTQPPVNLHIEVAGCYAAGAPYPLDYALVRLFDGAGHELRQAGGETNHSCAPMCPRLDATLNDAGTYYVGVSDWVEDMYDPKVACSIQSYEKGRYDVLIGLTPSDAPQTAERNIADAPSTRDILQGNDQEQGLFASAIAQGIGKIESLDPATGLARYEFDAPEITFGGAEGLASDGNNFFFVGSGWYPRLYQLDANSGDVQSDFILSYGSGFYSDATTLEGELFLLDYREGSIHVVDASSQQYLRSLPIGAMHGIHAAGGLASASYPNRLYLGDAFNDGKIYEIEPVSGALTATIEAVNNRPIALASVHESELWIGDWDSHSLEVTSRSGDPLGEMNTSRAVSSLSSTASPFRPFDIERDGNVDLHDFATFQRCFHVPLPLNPQCAFSDADGNGMIDAADFAPSFGSWSGP